MHIWLLSDTSKDGEERRAMEWELGFIDTVVDNPPSGKPDSLVMYGLAERSYDDEIKYVVSSNFATLLMGFVLLFIYIFVVLGNFNWIEQRAFLSIAGMLVIGLALGSCYGLGFYLRVSFNDMCPVIPFLLLGIGVDDMFVIVQSLDNLEEKPGEEIEERVARAMKHAGVSILVTSITDSVTFFIGSTSSMPILRGFCYFCGIGVIFLFLFAITFFVACLVLDEKRKERQILARPDWNPPSWTRARPGKYIFQQWISPLIVKWPVSILVLGLALAFATGGAFGLANIESDYDSIWYMRHESYQYKFYSALADNFRGHGERVDIYIGN